MHTVTFLLNDYFGSVNKLRVSSKNKSIAYITNNDGRNDWVPCCGQIWEQLSVFSRKKFWRISSLTYALYMQYLSLSELWALSPQDRIVASFERWSHVQGNNGSVFACVLWELCKQHWHMPPAPTPLLFTLFIPLINMHTFKQWWTAYFSVEL